MEPVYWVGGAAVLRKPLGQALALWFASRLVYMIPVPPGRTPEIAWAITLAYFAFSLGVAFWCLRIIGASRFWATIGAGMDWAVAAYVPHEGLVLPALILLTAGYLWIRRRLIRAVPAATEPAAGPR